jgi:hypothetical protein
VPYTKRDRKKRTSCNVAVYLDKQSVAIEVREAKSIPWMTKKCGWQAMVGRLWIDGWS